MAEEAVSAVGAGPDVNKAGNPTEIAMAYLQDEVTFDSDSLNLLLWKTKKYSTVHALSRACTVRFPC